MANGHPWFKDYPSDFLGGTNGMPPYQFAVYVRIIWLMYDTNGPVPFNDRYLAAMCGLGVGTFRKAVDALLQLQKLTLCNGCLVNQRAAQSVAQRAAQRAALSATRAAAQALSVKSRKNKKANENKENGIAKDLQTNGKTNSKSTHILEARERESPYRDLSLSSESKNAARVARVDDARSQRSEAPENEDRLPSGLTRKQAAAIDAQIERDRQEFDARLKKNPPPPTFEQFWAAYPLDSRSSEENCRKIWNDPALGDYDHRMAVEGIAVLLAWVNEAPSDPEREIPTAEFWLSRRRGSAMVARFPHLNPNARTISSKQPESENAA